MIIKILIALAVIVIGLVAVVARRPSDFSIVRTATMAAPAPAVFAQVNDFHRWQAWSPWAKRDPGMKQTYGGAAAGTGATYAWAGNREVGEGRMTLVESRPSELIRVNLEFLKPFAATSTAQFTFTPERDRTAVTWSMTGKRNFTAKALDLVMNMDRMIGGDFEKGLAEMKSVVEKQ
jgi:polyketide cyclase/dehydrase/lipid transport protein